MADTLHINIQHYRHCEASCSISLSSAERQQGYIYSWLSLIHVVNTLSTRGVFNPKPITCDQCIVTPPLSLDTITDVVHIRSSFVYIHKGLT